jgi:hypothetical protein
MGKVEKRQCYTCGGSGHLTRACPSARCHYCGQAGHVAKACRMGASLAARDQVGVGLWPQSHVGE